MYISFILENYQIIIAVMVLIAGGIIAVRKTLLQPSNEQVAKVEEWLLWAVSDAERYLGSGTGKLKLSLVYDSFLKAFPWISRIIPVALFSDLVDEALDKMRELLEKNTKATAVIKVTK